MVHPNKSLLRGVLGFRVQRQLLWALLCAASLALVVSSPAVVLGAAICVSGSTPGCETTIQAAIDIAVGGDTVTVLDGRYDENVVIPAGKDGLRLVGDGGVLDGDLPNTGVALTVESNDVTVEGLVIRNAEDHLIAAGTEIAPVSGFTIDGATLEGSRSACVRVYGDGFTARRTTTRYCGLHGILVTGNDATITKSRASYTQSDAYSVTGDDADLQRNQVILIDGDGFEVFGDRARIVRNKVRIIDNAGVDVDGYDVFVSKNKISHIDGTGVNVDPPDDAASGSTGNGGEISNNSVFSSTTQGCVEISDFAEPEFDPVFASVLVSGNRCRRAVDEGIAIVADGAIVTDNRVSQAGAGPLEPCVSVKGDGAVVTGNSGSSCAGGGLLLVGSSGVVSDNTMKKTFGYGFEVGNATDTSDSVVVSDNLAQANLGFGFAVRQSATAAALSGNKALKNREDLCDAGTATTSLGDVFDTELDPLGADCMLRGEAP